MAQENDKIRAMGWALNLLTTGCLAVGAWFFSGLSSNVNELTNAVNSLKTEIAVLKNNEKQVDRLETAIVLLQKQLLEIKTNDRWTGSDMTILLSRLKKENQSLNMPEIQDLLHDDK